MKKNIIIACLSVFCIIDGFSQANIGFEKESHDFGELKEGDKAEYEFTVLNTGTQPLIISDVKASCGCTTPSWTKEPIAPGASGKVKAAYGTLGRPGYFNKSITVHTNAENAPSKMLMIRGMVTKKEDVQYTAEQLRVSPKIVLEKTQHTFGTLEKNAKITYKLPVKNLGRSDLKISDITSSCNCVKYTMAQPFIKSGETGLVEIVYTPASLNEVDDILNIKSNDLTTPTVKFTFSSKVVESLVTPSIVKENKAFVPFK